MRTREHTAIKAILFLFNIFGWSFVILIRAMGVMITVGGQTLSNIDPSLEPVLFIVAQTAGYMIFACAITLVAVDMWYAFEYYLRPYVSKRALELLERRLRSEVGEHDEQT